ncbi:6375_t:CDS:1, partial [Racocetra persica]
MFPNEKALDPNSGVSLKKLDPQSVDPRKNGLDPVDVRPFNKSEIVSPAVDSKLVRPLNNVNAREEIKSLLDLKKVEPSRVKPAESCQTFSDAEPKKQVEQKPETIKISRVIPDEFLVKTGVPRKM